MSNESIHQPDDKAYKDILSKRENFIDFLKGFIEEEWINQIDLAPDNLVLVNKSFILNDYKEKEADIIYRLKLGDKDIIFYVVLELQSTVDFTMAFRLLIYMTELWKQVFLNSDKNERERKGYKLPAIIPIVVYNGSAKWTAVRSFKEMQAGSEFLGEYLLDFKYKFVDVHECPEKQLYDMKSLIGTVFSIEQCETSEELLNRLEKLIAIAKSFSDESWVEFKNWIIHILALKFPDEVKNEIYESISKVKREEANAMVSNVGLLIEKELNSSRIEGKIEGKMEGKMEGKEEVVRAAVLRGLSLEVVSEITGLDIEKVKEIAEKCRM